MLSHKILNTIKLSRNKISQSTISPLSTSSITLKNSDKSKEIYPIPERKLKPWREHFDPVTKQPLLPIDPESGFFKFFQTEIEFTPSGVKKFFKKKVIKYQKELQQFNEQRNEILGSDLSLAHFLIYQGGKVKFKGHDKWISLEKGKQDVDIPNRFNVNYILTEFDASDILLYYESLDNFKNLPRIKRAIFARSPLFDDWYVDKISSLFPNLEYLDISDCPKVSEKGLEALYRTGNLKTLIVTNNKETAAFELTCLMLEDCIPGLKIEILEPKEKRKLNK